MTISSDAKTRVTSLNSLKPQPGGTDCLVVIYSADDRTLGHRHLLEQREISIGRDQDNDIVLESDAVSRHHCRLERGADGWHLMDSDSTNGTYINDGFVTDAVLRQGDQVKVGDTIFKYLSGSNVEAQYFEAIYKMMIVDGLTGTFNKRFLGDAFEREIPRARRHQRSLSVLMFDVDDFRNINNTYGHLAGDYVLKELANVVKSRLRPDDVLGRFGGEEFCAILPETAIDGARIIAEDLRRRIDEKKYIFDGTEIRVTVSMGVIELQPEMDVHSLLRLVDEKLYEAKRAGKNCVKG